MRHRVQQRFLLHPDRHLFQLGQRPSGCIRVRYTMLPLRRLNKPVRRRTECRYIPDNFSGAPIAQALPSNSAETAPVRWIPRSSCFYSMITSPEVAPKPVVRMIWSGPSGTLTASNSCLVVICASRIFARLEISEHVVPFAEDNSSSATRRM